MPAFVQRKIANSKIPKTIQISTLSQSQSQPLLPAQTQNFNPDEPLDEMHHTPAVPPKQRETTPKSKLRTRAGNSLYKSVKEGNSEVENLPGMPKYYNHNYPIQSMVTSGNKKAKSMMQFLLLI